MSNKTDRIYNCIKAASEVKKFLKSQNLFETYKKSFYPYIALLFAAEFEVSSLSSGHLAKISSIIKRVFFNAMDIPFYKTYDKFSYKIRLFCFYICFPLLGEVPKGPGGLLALSSKTGLLFLLPLFDLFLPFVPLAFFYFRFTVATVTQFEGSGRRYAFG